MPEAQPPSGDLLPPEEVANILNQQVAEIHDNEKAKEAIQLEKQFIATNERAYRAAQIQRLIDDNNARKSFGQAIFVVTVLWMFTVLGIVYNSAAGKIHLSDTVIITLITTTTANVFGFFYVVVNYLFNKDKSPI